MPIPYMGSKRKSAQMIYNTITNHANGYNSMVDLFCGGFSIGEIFYKNGYNVIANDKNKFIVSLLEIAINKKLPFDITSKFVTREDFKTALENPNKYDEWYIGYLMTVWSFGNNTKGYLFSEKNEQIKKAGHELVINKNIEEVKKYIPVRYLDGILKLDTWQKRRIALVKVSKLLKTRTFELQQLERLERLEQLERLERLQHKIVFTSLDYDKVKIPENSIIYCDPPYKGTAEYAEGDFDHGQFWDWVREKSKKNKIFVSEYTAPNDFKYILKFNQKSSLNHGNQSHNNQPAECLFVYNNVK